MLLDLHDDLVLCIMRACDASGRACLASTCRRLRCLSLECPVKSFRLTHRQHTSVMTWLSSPDVAPAIQRLVATRCMSWRLHCVKALVNLRSLTLAFCRVHSGFIDHLPPTLVHLDAHQVVPPPGMSFGRLCFRHLPRLRVLRVVFNREPWEGVFIAGLPRGLRQLHLRNASSLVVQSFMPKGLRQVDLHAHDFLLLRNRLPNGLRSASLACDTGVVCADKLPNVGRKLRAINLSGRFMRSYGYWTEGADRFPVLRKLCLAFEMLEVDAARLATIPLLEHLEIRMKMYLWIDAPWPEGHPLPPTLIVTVAGVAGPW